ISGNIIASHARTYGRTTFFSSHLIDEVERCADRIGIIHEGRMRFEGALAQLRDEVRRVRFRGEPVVVSERFELWSERSMDGETLRTYRAPSAAWQELQFPSESVIERLTLEDIFLSCVGSRSLKW
nr:hypothetical protein [Pirellula sp.]